MYRTGGMASPISVTALLALQLLNFASAGPLGPLPNVTSSELGLKEGSCALGDVVYMPGDHFPGASPCERCQCAAGDVRCERQRCEPRPGCKAVHRPDHCCPTYQCECEQEGRVYGNGEKLVDPQDPCRVCYCQGGEVVCRRIACFVRDDCRPRLVPGRCCPEYDNCPLRGVTTVPGVAPSVSTTEEILTSAAPTAPKENIKQEITIKEITPVSEIPIITEVKIKEILPSPSIEVAEYASSKSPLIVREATSEKTFASASEPTAISEDQPSTLSSPGSMSPLPFDIPTNPSQVTAVKNNNDAPPSKISLSTQDSINSEIYPVPSSIAAMGVPAITPDAVATVSLITKQPVVEEEDPTFLDHNPAFPPIPDDLSVLSNHEDEIVHEQNVDTEQGHAVQEVSVSSASPFTEAVIIMEPLTTTTVKQIPLSTQAPTFKIIETSPATTSTGDFTTTEHSTTAAKLATTANTESHIETSSEKLNPMLNLRSAIPTEILNLPSFVPEEINGELDEITEGTTVTIQSIPLTTFVPSSQQPQEVTTEERTTEKLETTTKEDALSTTVKIAIITEPAKQAITETTTFASTSQSSQEQTTSSIAKSNIATEITAQTELSSLPIETSDQNPQEITNIAKETVETSTTTTAPPVDLTIPKISPPIESEIITVSRAVSSSTTDKQFENLETTEFIITPLGSSESATDAVELIKISAEPEKNAAIIEQSGKKKNNLLTDLINLVGDVAAIGDHTDGPVEVSRSSAEATTTSAPTTTGSISESEELIPVNAGYKSKNNNWNLNSITEVPLKSKSQVPVTKQKMIEIEGEDSETITDAPAPHDTVEPTTRRPIIDIVSDDMPNNNKTEKKDIEIITKSYVPTINRRPTKVVMKKNNEKPVFDETSTTTDETLAASSSEVATEANVSTSTATAPAESVGTTEDAERRIETAFSTPAQ